MMLIQKGWAALRILLSNYRDLGRLQLILLRWFSPESTADHEEGVLSFGCTLESTEELSQKSWCLDPPQTLSQNS
jgi:hypothetical protein